MNQQDLRAQARDRGSGRVTFFVEAVPARQERIGVGERSACARVAYTCIDLQKGPEHKKALVHARVRHLQVGFVDNLASIKKKIEVDGARRVGHAALSAHFLLHRQERAEQFARASRRTQAGHGVEERAAALWCVYGRGFNKRRNALHGDALDPAQEAQGALEVLFAIAQVGAQRDIGGSFHVR